MLGTKCCHVKKKKSTAPIVQSAEAFANVVKKAMASTTVMLFLDKDINRDNSAWVKAKAISGISKMPGIKCSPSSGLEFFTNAITPIKQNVDTLPVNTINISTENWVVVKWDESVYAGEVTQVSGNILKNRY
ncbi:hypothetical protein AVEN_128163-1 [Araneus ventricosus]|uniref:Uncharacterized protein n=1 Tax=Araneus ventricosus TaxID=182803 RepID=A0A4Y1ZZP6_ARAVE|nr:hypothetical protein AVEN_128163-1 [Araneus ventricosus]